MIETVWTSGNWALDWNGYAKKFMLYYAGCRISAFDNECAAMAYAEANQTEMESILG